MHNQDGHGHHGHHMPHHLGFGFGVVALLFAHPVMGRFLLLCVLAWILWPS